MIDAGSLNDRISFYECVESRSEYGSQNLSTWKEKCRKWAKVTYNKGARALNAGEVWLPTTISILCRYDEAIDDRMRVEWDKKRYRIESLNASKRDGSCTIVATKLDEGNG